MVMFVGHNPTAASLAHLLDDGDPDPDAFRAMSAGFPPAALAVLEVPRPLGRARRRDAPGSVGFHPGQG